MRVLPMSRDISYTPEQWGPSGVTRVPGSPDPGVFVMLRQPQPDRGPGDAVVIWHWHTPLEGEARWQAAGCGKHQVVSLDPLHLEPSLGCENGCPNHGYIRGGSWTDA